MSFIKNHWKKLTFASGVLSYGGYQAWWEYEVQQHMRKVCEEVANYAETNLGKPKRVLVVMNPVAKGKKTEKMFQNYCEPLLHLAGYAVDIVKTTHVGHAKSLIEQLQTLPDAIVVAGGDGTSSEVVTGLLRREKDTACPLVFLPLGNHNETALSLATTVAPKNSLEYTKCLSNTLLPLVYEQSRTQSVIKFDVLDENNEKNSKAIYGLTRFSWGLLRDLEAIKDKYWYFGKLRYDAAALFNAFSDKLNWKVCTEVEYTPPCDGCSNCVEVKKLNKPKPLFMKFLRESATPETVAAARINTDCSIRTQDHIEANQLFITCNGGKELQTQCIKSLEPGLDFVKNVRNVARNNISPAIELRSRTIQLTPAAADNPNQCFTIDGEEYDIRPVRLSLIPNAIKVYC